MYFGSTSLPKNGLCNRSTAYFGCSSKRSIAFLSLLSCELGGCKREAFCSRAVDLTGYVPLLTARASVCRLLVCCALHTLCHYFGTGFFGHCQFYDHFVTLVRSRFPFPLFIYLAYQCAAQGSLSHALNQGQNGNKILPCKMIPRVNVLP